MKIAIPTRNNHVDSHFGHCEHYTIFTVSDNKKIEATELYNAPEGCGCKSNLGGILKQKGVTILLAGNMGQGAVNNITMAGIQVYRGCSGNVIQVVETFLKGELTDSGETCDHNDHQHQHHHNH